MIPDGGAEVFAFTGDGLADGALDARGCGARTTGRISPPDRAREGGACLYLGDVGDNAAKQ